MHKNLYSGENSYQREFNPKLRLYAPQEYQAHHTKTTEKAISKLEINADFDRLKQKVRKHIIREMVVEYVCEYDFSRDVAAPRKELLGIEKQLPVKGIIKKLTYYGQQNRCRSYWSQ